MKLYLWPSEAIVLRHALMSYRNGISERNADQPPYPLTDGFELVAADTLIERLDILSEGLLTKDRRRMNTPAPSLVLGEP